MKNINNILGVLKDTGWNCEKFCFKPLIQILQKAVFLKMLMIIWGSIPLHKKLFLI